MSEEMLITALVIMWLVSAEQFTRTMLVKIFQYFVFGCLTIIWRNLPVMVEGPAPSSEPQDLHDDKSNDDISSHKLDQEVLFQTQPKYRQSRLLDPMSKSNSRKSTVHEQQTSLDAPECNHLHMFGDENQFRSVFA
jgi:hypothetical protein